MLSDQTDSLIPVLTRLGLSSEESQIYLYLLSNSPSTALSISRAIKMGRTKVYRILDILKKKNLIEFKLGDHGLSFVAAPASTFDMILWEKREELSTLEKSLDLLKMKLEENSRLSSQYPKTIYYEGVKGCLTANWNALTAEPDEGIRIFEMSGMNDFMTYETAEEIRRGFLKNKIKDRQLTNIPDFAPWTDVTEYITNFWNVRYLDPKIITISFEIVLYNNIVALYTYKGKTPYCIEIHDDALAKMYKQIFDVVWEIAVPMKILSPQGHAKVVAKSRNIT